MNKEYKSALMQIENLHPQEISKEIEKNNNYICNQKIKDGKIVFQLFKNHERKDYSFTRFCGEFNIFQMKNLIKHLTQYKKYF